MSISGIVSSIETTIASDAEKAIASYAYIGSGVAGAWYIVYPDGDPALVPWVGLLGAGVLINEAPVLRQYAPALGGMGIGVFTADLVGLPLMSGAALGLVGGYMALGPTCKHSNST